MKRPCLDCGRPTLGSRCQDHRRAKERRRAQGRRPRQRGYGGNWDLLSRHARELQPWCTFCHATEDLTADHVIPVSKTDTTKRLTLADVIVLCRPCNSSRGNRDLTDTERIQAGVPPRARATNGPSSQASGWSLIRSRGVSDA